MSFCDRLISLSIMTSRFIHVVSGIRISSLYKAEYYSFVSVYHILIIHLSVTRHLGYFHLLAIVIHAAMSIGVQISVRGPALTSFGYIPRSGIPESYSNSMFNFLRTCHTIFHSGYTIL